MKIVVKNGTYELENSLKQNGYEVETYDDDVEFFKVVEKEVEVEKIVEAELPEYLKVIDVEINKLVDEKVAKETKKYEVYKNKFEMIESLFKSEEVVDDEE